MKKTTLLILFLLSLWHTQYAQVALVKDIVPGGGSAFLDGSQAGIAFKGNYIFAANGAEGNELWISDGTPNGTSILKDIHTTLSSDPGNFLIAFDRVYFTATSLQEGRELWVTDGTTGGTIMVNDIAQGPENSDPLLGERFGEYLYFGAAGSPEGHELWRMDSLNQVSFFKDINPFNSSWPRAFTLSGDVMFFAANALDVTDPDYDEDEPFVTDGTVEGTKQIYNVTFDWDGAGVRDFTPFNGSTFFLADGFGGLPPTRHLLFIAEDNGDNTYEYSQFGGFQWLMPVNNYLTWILGENFYSFDGDLILPIARATNPEGYSDPTPRVSIESQIAFPAEDPDDPKGIELFFTDGTFEGTSMPSDIYPGEGSSDPRHMVSYDNRIYFAASPDDSNRELFVSDGTSSGTFMAADVYPGPEGSFPTSLAFVDSTLFFFAFTPATGIELFKYTPQTTGLANNTYIPFKGKVYPQPASSEEGVIYVEWDNKFAWNVANLSDSAGRHVKQIDVKNLSKIQIPITDLVPGIYQLSLSNEELTSTMMLSIQ